MSFKERFFFLFFRRRIAHIQHSDCACCLDNIKVSDHKYDLASKVTVKCHEMTLSFLRTLNYVFHIDFQG